jgi:FkbM family methyltransferase
MHRNHSLELDFRNSVHATIASLARLAPRFRGKARVGAAVTRALQPSQAMAVRMRDGSTLRLDPRSETERFAIWTGEYDCELMSQLSRCLSEGDTALDIGANVGFWTVALGKRLRDLRGMLFAFEPVPANFARLEENVDLNDLGSTVCCMQAALGEEEGSLELAVDHRNGAVTGNAVVVRGGVGNYMKATDQAQVARLDRVAEELNVTRCRFMKIDIEGAEAMAFRGGMNFLRSCRPIIFGEFNRFWMRQFNDSFLDVARMFEPLSYLIFQRTHPTWTRITAPTVDLSDVLLVPAETSRASLQAIGIFAE